MPRNLTRIAHVCQSCQAEFTTTASVAERGQGRFCSLACYGDSLRRTVTLVCDCCGTQFTRKQSAVVNRNYCSARCKHLRFPPSVIEISSDGLTARVPLYSRGDVVRAYALIDAADVDLISRWRWCFHGGYATRGVTVNNKSVGTIRMHHVIAGVPDANSVVDHINRDGLDNRKANLRIIPKVANAQNLSTSRTSTSPYRGVNWNVRNGKWMARVRVNNKQHYLGGFDSETEAAEVAAEARRRLMPYAVD